MKKVLIRAADDERSKRVLRAWHSATRLSEKRPKNTTWTENSVLLRRSSSEQRMSNAQLGREAMVFTMLQTAQY